MSEGINVFSAFDGMSCGQLALERAGIKVKNYFASEVDKYAIKVAKKNYPNTIHVGDITKVKASDLPKIDLLIGGSPCQGFSLAGKQLNFDDLRSALFFEYLRLKNELNPDEFILENVMMASKVRAAITQLIGMEPIAINSALLSAQNRERYYWTNIYSSPAGLFGDHYCKIPQPKNKGLYLKDIVQTRVDEKYFLSKRMTDWLIKHCIKMQAEGNGQRIKILYENAKSGCLNTVMNKVNLECDFIPVKEVIQMNGSKDLNGCQPQQHNRYYNLIGLSPALVANLSGKAYKVLIEGRIRKLTPVECERLQTVPDNYTEGVSDTQRYRMLGNGWTVDVISYILSFSKFRL